MEEQARPRRDVEGVARVEQRLERVRVPARNGDVREAAAVAVALVDVAAAAVEENRDHRRAAPVNRAPERGPTLAIRSIRAAAGGDEESRAVDATVPRRGVKRSLVPPDR